MTGQTPHELDFHRLLADLPRDDALRSEHRERLRRLALEAFDAAQASSTVEPKAVASTAAESRWRRAYLYGRKLMTRPLPRIMAAAVTLVLAGWMFVPGTQSTASAFNEFVDKLIAAKTAKFDMEMKTEGVPMVQSFKAEFLAPNRLRQEILGGVNIADYDQGKIMTLIPATKEAVVMTIKNRPQNAKPENLFENVQRVLQQKREAGSEPAVSLGEREIDGKKAVGFQTSWDEASGAIGSTVKIWGDPETGFPIRIETVWNGVPKTESVMKNFELNIPVDEKKFSLEIPEGYTKREVEVDGSPPTEEDFLAALKTAYEAGNTLPASLDGIGVAMFISKMTASKLEEVKNDTEAAMQFGLKLGRGLTFATQLPKDADAHWNGNGAKQDEKDRPVFWYKPAGNESYRVIDADLSVRESKQAPEAKGAVKLKK